MNRRGFLAAIPGLGLLSRLCGKKEGPVTDDMPDWRNVKPGSVYRGSGDVTFEYSNIPRIKSVEEMRALQVQMSNCDRAVIAAGCPDALSYRLRPQYVIEKVWCRDETGHSRTRRIVRLETPDEVSKRLWLDELGWYTDHTGCIRTAPGWRGTIDFRSKPTFAELSRQWDSA